MRQINIFKPPSPVLRDNIVSGNAFFLDNHLVVKYLYFTVCSEQTKSHQFIQLKEKERILVCCNVHLVQTSPFMHCVMVKDFYLRILS